jgi:hypothetical protein
MTVVEEPRCGNLSPEWYSVSKPTKPKGNQMPNWCYNYMTVMGNKREIAKFVKDITVAEIQPQGIYSHATVEYDMNKLVPLDPRGSKEIKTTNADGVETTFSAFSSKSDGFDGYLDALETWGSKWGACRPEIDDTTPAGNTITVRYESAWSPADGLIQRISALYPNLIFGTCSDEESRAFVCWSVFHNGIIIEAGERDPQYLTPELLELSKKAEAEDAEEDALEEWWEAHSEWNNELLDQCDTDMSVCMNEYKKHLAYVRRCEKEGRTPRTFVSSV